MTETLAYILDVEGLSVPRAFSAPVFVACAVIEANILAEIDGATFTHFIMYVEMVPCVSELSLKYLPPTADMIRLPKKKR